MTERFQIPGGGGYYRQGSTRYKANTNTGKSEN